MSHLQILTVPRIMHDNKLICDISSLTSLTIKTCNANQIHVILNNAHTLKYLKILDVPRPNEMMYRVGEDNSFLQRHAFHLKQLDLSVSEVDCSNIFMILKRTVNLEKLRLSIRGLLLAVFNVNEWEQMITSSLSCLRVFEFDFQYIGRYDEDNLPEIFKEFQSDFWQKQCHGYITCFVSETCPSICTIPYISEHFVLDSSVQKYYKELRNAKNMFDNVKYIQIDSSRILHQWRLYFPNVISLNLRRSYVSYFAPSLIEDDIKFLSNILNLSRTQHLYIESSCLPETSSALLQLLKQTPNISLLSIDPVALLSFLNDNDELCNYLKSTIKILVLTDHPKNLPASFYKANKLWDTFSNIEQLTCFIKGTDSLTFLLKQLPKLLRINYTITGSLSELDKSLIEEEIRELKLNSFVEIDSFPRKESFTWIIPNSSIDDVKKHI